MGPCSYRTSLTSQKVLLDSPDPKKLIGCQEALPSLLEGSEIMATFVVKERTESVRS